MRKLFTYISLIFAVVCYGRTYSIDEIPNVQLQDHTKHLSDPDGIVLPVVARQIDSLLLDARRQSSAEIVAVIVDDIDSWDIDQFATDLFNKWGIGKSDKNNGILILVSKEGRAVTIRSGYGSDGVLPDILAGRIIRDQMIPRFREGAYSQGLLDGVKEVHRLVTDPDAVAELLSKEDDNWNNEDADIFKGYLIVSVIVTALMLLCLGIWYLCNSKKSDYEKYTLSSKFINILWVAAAFFMFVPIIAPIILMLLRRHWRQHKRNCPNCGAKMCKLDEDTDNQYLTMSQDLEEKLNSVDYDVWLCPQCGETDIYSFVNKNTPYQECPKCHTHAMKINGTRVLKPATVDYEGIGEKQYICLNCHHKSSKRYTIPQKVDVSTAAVVGGILNGMSHGGGFRGGSGGFGGGFGGGLTGGGGATGRW